MNQASGAEKPDERDFLISYTESDRQWAEWIGQQLEDSGYTVYLREWDIRPGMNIVAATHQTVQLAKQTLLVLSSLTPQADDAFMEWASALYQDPRGVYRKLLPVRVEPCDIHGLLEPIVPIDLVALGEDEARERLLTGLKGRAKPDQALSFPPQARETLGTIPFPGAFPPVWNIPIPRNPFFLGRDKLLARLHSNFATLEKAVDLSQIQALCGPGGIGKTQLAIEYAYRYRHEYQAVLWVRAYTREELLSSLLSVAQLLDLPEKDWDDQMMIAQAVKHWLRDHTHWLCILDNADEIAVAKEFLPLIYRGHLLLTTRAQTLGNMGRALEVESMEPDTGALLLLHRSGLLALDAPLREAPPANVTRSRDISRELGGLPLALDQAGAYLEQTGCSLEDYQQFYRISRKRMLETRGGILGEHPDLAEHADPVATTWSVSFEQVAQKNDLAPQILSFCAFLAAEAIPLELFTGGPEALADDPALLWDALAVLRNYSLVKYNPATRTLSIHHLVQVVLLDTLSRQEQSRWLERVLLTLKALFPDGGIASWPQGERLLPHVLATADFFLVDSGNLDLAECLLSAAGYLIGRTQFADAEQLLRTVRQIYEQQEDQDPSNYAITLSFQAMTSLRQEKRAQAIQLFEETLHYLDKHPHLNDALRVATLNNYGLLYRMEDQFGLARSYFEQALGLLDPILSSEQPSTIELLVMSNLLTVYVLQMKDDLSEPLFQRLTYGLEQLEDFTHPDLILALGNLGSIYAQQNKYQEAESFGKRALVMAEQLLGSEHPNVAMLLMQQARILMKQDKYAQAEPLAVRAYQICEKRKDIDHSFVITSHLTLAAIAEEKEQLSAADDYLQQALQMCEQRFPSALTTKATVLCGLGNVYCKQKRYAEAEKLILQAIQIREQEIGPQDLTVASALMDLADVYKAWKHYDQAEPLLQRSLAISEHQGGLESSAAGIALHHLAKLYSMQKMYKKAEPLFLQALKIQEMHADADQLDLVPILNNLAYLYQNQGKAAKAEQLFQRALSIQEQKYGSDHLEVATALFRLAELDRQGPRKMIERALLYERVLQIREQHLDSDDPATLKARKANVAQWKLVRITFASNLILYTLLAAGSLIFWFYHKFDIWSWIALVIATAAITNLVLVGRFVVPGIWRALFQKEPREKAGVA